MAKRDKADPGTVSWVDLQTPDLDRARAFYGELLGWSFEGGEDASTAFYTTAMVGDRRVAGMAKLSPGSPFPPMWSVYLATEDADACARRVTEAGGAVVAAPMDVMELGRMAYFTDPTGAYIGVWQGKQHQGAQLIEEAGALMWNEIYTRDVARARDFYSGVFGLEARHLEAEGIDYWTLHRGDAIAFGAMQMGAQFPPEVPAHWNTYFGSPDVDAAFARVPSLGGTQVAPPFDTPFGRIAFLADPFGATFNLMRPGR